MPTAVSPNHSSQSPSGHYDGEAGQCVGQTAAPPRSSAAPPVTTGSPEPSPAAVDQLVKAASARQQSSCVLPVFEAALYCAGAAVTILAGSATGVGAVAGAAILGATCGVKVMSAEECLRQP